MRNMVKKLRFILIMIICVDVLLGTGYLLWQNKTKSDEKQLYLKEQNQKLTNINQQIAEIQEKYDQLKIQYDEQTQIQGTMLLCFLNPSDKAYTGAFSSFEQYGYTGTLVFNDGAKPGDDDMITVDHFTEMIDHGWSCAISSTSLEGEAGSDSWKNHMQECYQAIVDAAGVAPDACYLGDNIYTSDLDEALLSLGFTSVFYMDAEESQDLNLLKEAEGGLARIPVTPYRQDDVNKIIERIVNEGVYAGFVTQVSWKSNEQPEKEYQYSDYGLSQFLWTLDDYVSDEKLDIMSTSQLQKKFSGLEQNIAGAEEQFGEQMDEYSSQLAELQDEKQTLMGQ